MALLRAVARVRFRPGQRIDPTLKRARGLCLAAASAGLLIAVAGCTGHDSRTSSAPTGTSSSSSSSASSGAPSSTGAAPSRSSATGSASGKGGTPGAIHKTVPAKTLATAKPVATNETAKFGNKVSARISAMKSINAVAHGLGEISGPAVEVTFVIENGTSSAIDLSGVTANLEDADGIPSVSMTGSPADPFAGTLAAGKSSTGTYVFALSKSHRNPVTISLSYTTEAPVVLFVGNAQ